MTRPRLEQTCGIRTAYYNATVPFARMEADQERIKVRVFGLFEYQFQRSELSPIRIHRGWISHGIVLESKLHRIILWLDARRTLEDLRSLGFPVEMPPDREADRRD